jgi:exosortase E/protease (VPEID-CTERM system)
MRTSIVDREPGLQALPIGRWLLAAGLLIAEYVLAVFLFDAQRLPVAKDTGAFHFLGESMPLIIVMMTAMLVVGASPTEAERRQLAAAFRERRRTWPLLAGHLLAYAVALGVTVFVFNANLELRHPWLWVALWAVSGVSSLLLLIAAVVPKPAFQSLRRPATRALTSSFLVGLAALLAGYATARLWQPMSRWTLEIVDALLRLLGQEVVSVPEEFIVGTPSYEVFIDRQCSGYEGIGLITVLLGFYLFYFRKSLKFPNALALLPIGVVLVWLANSVRIAALIGVGTWFSPEIAEGGFHSAAGWLLFCVITLSLVALSRQTDWFSTDQGHRKGSLRTPEGAYLLPLLVLLATGLVGALFSAGFDILYPLRMLTPLIPLWLFRSYYKDLSWSWSWTPIVLGVLVFILWVALEPRPDPQTANVIPDALAQMHWALAAFWLTARVLGSAVVVPVVEELAFRGYLLRRLIDADFTAVSPRVFTASSFLISSAAFGLLHGRWFAGILAGMIYAAAQYRHGRVTDAIVAHAMTNGLIAAYVLLFGQWGFW